MTTANLSQTNPNVSQFPVGEKSVSLKSLRQHEQFCLGLQIILNNGAELEDIGNLLNILHEQAESLAVG